ncbi:MAG: hypothetical protein F9K40_17510 [Kofleriaceae bacterium]|nr:MAG: hypothetical protein F9K40_17510 [Kofleriaceae bacterium]
MQREEVLCRDFYRWELKENLRERRRMREEEVEGLRLRKEEQRLRKEAMEAAMLMRGGDGGNKGSGGEGVQLNASLNAEIAARRDISLSYEQRRQVSSAVAELELASVLMACSLCVWGGDNRSSRM